jgi:nitrate/TMAO reductase-like tetraheme cytochrome c subunit
MRVILTVSMVLVLAALSPAEDPVDCVECHGSIPDRYTTQKHRFMEKVTFVHDTHYGRKDWPLDVELYCTTCHQRQIRHFDVSKESCFLCHFKNIEFNEGLSRCSLCHEIPTRPLQRQKTGEHPEEEPITHQSLVEAKVSCQSCHLEIVKGTGYVDTDTCLYCHTPDDSIMAEAGNQELMHKEHVSTLKARCFDCHEPIEHKRADFMEVSRKNCQACHPDHHIYQERLLAGDINQEVPRTPGLMFAVKTNCMGCHIEAGHDRKGEEVLKKGSAKACVACHTERHEAMLEEWKGKIREELEVVEEVRQKAEDALKKAQHTVPEETFRKAMVLFEKGQEFVNIVRYGNGVHNKKYSIALIDVAFANFEDIIDMLGNDEMEIKPAHE